MAEKAVEMPIRQASGSSDTAVPSSDPNDVSSATYDTTILTRMLIDVCVHRHQAF